MFRRKSLERTVKRQGERIIELEEELQMEKEEHQRERERNSGLYWELGNALEFKSDVLNTMAGKGTILAKFDKINELAKKYI